MATLIRHWRPRHRLARRTAAECDTVLRLHLAAARATGVDAAAELDLLGNALRDIIRHAGPHLVEAKPGLRVAKSISGLIRTLDAAAMHLRARHRSGGSEADRPPSAADGVTVAIEATLAELGTQPHPVIERFVAEHQDAVNATQSQP